MLSHDTRATGELLERIGCNGVTIKRWAKIYSKSSIWCMLCNKSVTVDHSGIGQVIQHAGSGWIWQIKDSFFFRPTKV